MNKDFLHKHNASTKHYESIDRLNDETTSKLPRYNHVQIDVSYVMLREWLAQ